MKLSGFNKGQTIVEAIIVITIVIILVTGLISGTTASLRATQDGRVRVQAIGLAQEGVEDLRTLRDTSWSSFFANANQLWCLGSSGVLTVADSGVCPVNVTGSDGFGFTRSVSLTWNDPTMIAVVTVSYPISGTQSRSVSLTTYFTQWKN